jgi:hypothetical protein
VDLGDDVLERLILDIFLDRPVLDFPSKLTNCPFRSAFAKLARLPQT